MRKIPIRTRWERLLPHLPDARWREVFLLITSSVSADYLIGRMQDWLNGLVAERAPVQELLLWAARKQLKLGAKYKPGAVRALYIGVGKQRRCDTYVAAK